MSSWCKNESNFAVKRFYKKNSIDEGNESKILWSISGGAFCWVCHGH